MRPPALLLSLLLLMPAALASGCEGTTSTTTTEHIIVEAGGTYVAFDVCQPGCLWSIWIYRETNGIPGLQRGDEVVDDTCGGAAYEPDSPPF